MCASFLILGSLPSLVFPQASVNVSNLDPVYHDIDQLVGQGLVDKIIMGQRPYSRKEIARITAEAMRHLSRLEKPLGDSTTSEDKKRALQERLDYVNGILDRLKSDYREELVQLGALEGEKSWYSLHTVEKVEASVLGTNSPAEALPVNNGLASIDAVINPFVDYREGRHLVEGFNLSLETSHWVRATNYLAFYVRPRFQLGVTPNGQPNDNKAYIQNLYGKLYFKNFELEVGRDNILWGQGPQTGILLSNNPRGLDMIKISNDSPGILPWIFKYLGANKLSFFYSDLGPNQNFPHAYLIGLKWSLQPLSFMELGFSQILQSGGEGSPPSSFGKRVGEFFAISDTDDKNNNQNVANKMGGFDIRFRIPPARGLELYGEAIYDDFGDFSSFTDSQFLFKDGSYLLGIYVPRLINSGKLDFRLEYHHTGVRFYRHGTFTSGLTLNQFILGDNLGSVAHGLYISSNWDVNRQNLLTFNAAFESRSGDVWGVAPPFTFVVVQDNPSENRYRGSVQWLHRFKAWPMFFRAQMGYERVQNFGFIAGNGRNNFLGEFALQINFDHWTQFSR